MFKSVAKQALAVFVMLDMLGVACGCFAIGAALPDRFNNVTPLEQGLIYAPALALFVIALCLPMILSPRHKGACKP
jgi:hypothetical protein